MRTSLKISVFSILLLLIGIQISVPLTARYQFNKIREQLSTQINLKVTQVSQKTGFFSTQILLKDISCSYDAVSYGNNEVKISYTLFHPTVISVETSSRHSFNGFKIKLEPITIQYNILNKQVSINTPMSEHPVLFGPLS